MSATAQELFAQARAALGEQRTADAEALLRQAEELCGPGDERLRVRLAISATWVTFATGKAPSVRHSSNPVVPSVAR